jgi:hypothetical protein
MEEGTKVIMMEGRPGGRKTRRKKERKETDQGVSQGVRRLARFVQAVRRRRRHAHRVNPGQVLSWNDLSRVSRSGRDVEVDEVKLMK